MSVKIETSGQDESFSTSVPGKVQINLHMNSTVVTVSQ